MSLFLASASPRRRALLEACGVPLAGICAPEIDEARLPGELPHAMAARLATAKARAVHADGWVLAADTVVHVGDDVLGKPASPEEAARMLQRLSGRWHAVTTGWCLRRGEEFWEAHRTARVRFRGLGPTEIAAYVASGEGLDKAGAYGVQGLGAALVSRVDGDFSTVVGLPMPDVLAALRAADIWE